MTIPIRAVIWDLDGVIIDSAEEHNISWHRMAQDEGVPFTDEQFYATFGMRNDAIIPLLWGEMSREHIQRMADKKELYYRAAIREKARALPGALELLSALKEAGYAQALASSAPIKNIEVVSEVLGLKTFLTALVSGETVPHGKPAPDVFLKAAQELGIAPSESLVIEDAVHGVEAAHAGGMRCVAVTYGKQTPGLLAAELTVNTLTEMSVEKIKGL
ncbi:HAD family hydrolase [Tengunoibacter tsumagoiensis]|uniref:Beta-phosphoglucomutase n=1 Tax=Tengunoibacter tsumagoiensis TaxID=2014871 RepID=A0A401ZZR8_9CHLR|nr:beta-phosphoglucomutase family hydrolase [Tengunoibacter tsumagoiensis]GCE12282.1 beta-phosphoglucomutase [Tengunoibacter tsumagoiensis]